MSDSNKILPNITALEAVKKYQIKLTFADDTAGIYDLSHLAGKGVFNSWDDDDNFFKVYIDAESGAISWPGGIDIDTLNVYCTLRGLNTTEYIKESGIYATD